MIRARNLKSRLCGATSRLFRDRRGATAVEYALIIALIVVAMIGSLQGVAGVTISMWNNVTTQVLRHG